MAARAPDPHNLRTLAERAAPIIQTDRECLGCGYNLRGLRLGVKCPECGMPSTAVFHLDDPLSVMPLRIILALVRGCWVGAIIVVLMVGTMLVDRAHIIDRAWTMSVLAILSVFWLGATAWLTPAFGFPQAIKRGFGVRSRLRKAARWLQIGWIVATGAAAADAVWNPAGLTGLLALGQTLGLLVGVSGLVVLSILLERLAEWARDEDSQKMFNWAMWAWPLAMVLYGPVQALISSWPAAATRYQLLLMMFIALWVFAIGTFPYGLLMLAKSVTLSILHNLEYKDRQERRQQREQARVERAAALARGTESQPMRSRSTH